MKRPVVHNGPGTNKMSLPAQSWIEPASLSLGPELRGLRTRPEARFANDGQRPRATKVYRSNSVWAQDELSIEPSRFNAAMRLDDLLERNPLGDARADGASCQKAEKPLQILFERGGMPRPHESGLD
jgi:hypothetical protein